MRLELDQTAHIVTDDDTGQEIFRCNCNYQYYGLMKKLLSPSQYDKHLSLGYDGIYHVSEKRVESGKAYMKDNPYNPR